MIQFTHEYDGRGNHRLIVNNNPTGRVNHKIIGDWTNYQSIACADKWQIVTEYWLGSQFEPEKVYMLIECVEKPIIDHIG